jgi:mono/diheme cytochrome c family protein
MWRPARPDVSVLRAFGAAAAACAVLAIELARPSAAQERDGAAIFRQMATVLQSPRCMNCHTREDFPRQGDDRHRHTFHVTRGPANTGAAGLHCATCHQTVNQAASGVPGAAGWRLAPLRMAWEGLSVADLCRALLDPHKGGMRTDQFVPHFGTSLVRWAWEPGRDRTGRERSKPPIPYDQFIALTRDWVATRAACPSAD